MTGRSRAISGSFRWLKAATLLMILLCVAFTASSQEMPPRPIIVSVNESQPLAFGAFIPGPAGGSVTVAPDYSRSSTGDIFLLNLGYIFTPAMFYVRANQGAVVSILNIPPVTLTGSGGGTLTLQPGPSLPSSPFVITVLWPQWTTVLIGGTLYVGDILANPPGSYSGSFYVTFIQE